MSKTLFSAFSAGVTAMACLVMTKEGAAALAVLLAFFAMVNAINAIHGARLLRDRK